MLHAINGTHVRWYCPGSEDRPCGVLNSAHIDETIYSVPAVSLPRVVEDRPLPTQKKEHQQVRGPVIALPPCACGMQTFLKADYSLPELIKCVRLMDDGQQQVPIIEYKHVHNLHAHHLLYQRGRAIHAPLIEMPDPSQVSHLAYLRHDTILALWFAHSILERASTIHVFASIDLPRLPIGSDVDDTKRIGD